MEFEYISNNFKFASWNLFVATCSVPSLLIGAWLFCFPESPKFLLECGEADEALEVLKDMYASNTGESASSFPVSTFRFYLRSPLMEILQITSLREKVRTMSVVSQQSTRSIRSLRIRKPKELKLLMQEIWEQTKALCKPPHLRYTIITCLIQFGLTSRYLHNLLVIISHIKLSSCFIVITH